MGTILQCIMEPSHMCLSRCPLGMAFKAETVLGLEDSERFNTGAPFRELWDVFVSWKRTALAARP